MWTRTLLRKRSAQVSTVAIVPSDDPKRLEQLLRTLESAGYNTSLWSVRGLFSVKNAKKDREIRSEFGGPMGLEEALRYADSTFRKSEHTALVILPATRSDVLNAFLKDWAFDYEIYESDSLVVVFGFTELTEDVTRNAIVIDVPLSTEEERRALCEEIANDLGVEWDEQTVAAGAGLTLHEFEAALVESVAIRRKITASHITAVKVEVAKKTRLLEIEEPKFGFERVGGYDEIKLFLKQNIVRVFEERERAETLALRPPRGILFFGPGGTGKTLFAKAMARELNLPFLRLKTENIVSRWYGETERSMARTLKFAEEVAPAVLFVDEIDRFGKRGQTGEHETTRRTFSILLEWLGEQERKTIVVAATNRPQDLDDAFVRVGRFDYMIPVLHPDAEARKSILEVHTSVARKVPLDEDVELTELAERTEGFSGAELEELVIRAARVAFRRNAEKVCWDDFEEALETFRIDMAARERQIKEYRHLASRFCNDLSLLRNQR
ncbi:ATP-binding protein [Archaeoglobus neptunius]|uniref:ATP-binding protein n=1 Tax=Archaeoglobus neptunius TaxID=2798580 RepID=UPI001925F3A5|nr:ATP-binding protein [Archaeoglobus neptunius]